MLSALDDPGDVEAEIDAAPDCPLFCVFWVFWVVVPFDFEDKEEPMTAGIVFVAPLEDVDVDDVVRPRLEDEMTELEEVALNEECEVGEYELDEVLDTLLGPALAW